MAGRNEVYRAISAFSTVLVSLTLVSCALWPPSAQSGNATTPPNGSALKTQALVMGMADDNIASLGESVYLLTRSGKLDSKGRWLAQSFLRT
jgi:hypothetical protein